MGRKKTFQDVDDPFATQPSLFSPPGVTAGSNPFPQIYRDEEGFLKVLAGTTHGIGIDYEGKNLGQPGAANPTIIGVSNNHECAAVRCRPELVAKVYQHALETGQKLVGHSVVGSDKPATEQVLGHCTPLEMWDDTIIRHYLAHPDLCKNPAKDEDDDDAGAMGFMNLWAMASLHTDLSQWKICVRGNSKVRLADGSSESIQHLVKSKYAGEVLCVDAEGRLTTRPVTGWYKTPRLGRKFYAIGYEHYAANGKPNQPSSHVTEDHQVLTKRGWVRADNLTKGDLIATGTPGLSHRQTTAVVGMLLGDGHLDKTVGRIHVAHCEKQYDYLAAKVNLLSPFGEKKFTVKLSKKVNNQDLYHWKSRALPVFGELRDTWNEEFVLSNFSLASLAIWYLDDGYRSIDGLAEIACVRLPVPFANKLADAITQLGIPAKAVVRPSASGPRIIFCRKSSQLLFDAIREWVPACLGYKLDVEYQGAFRSDLYEPDYEMYWDRAIVSEISVPSEEQTVYCLDVADFHNFCLLGGVVHNCRGKACDGPCPADDVFGYCAIDAFAGLDSRFGSKGLDALLAKRQIPESLVWDLTRLSDICTRMQNQGIAIDWDYVDEMEQNFEEKKLEIFPFDLVNGKPVYNRFNPKSPKQVLEYFEKGGIVLASTDKKDVRKALEKAAKKTGHTIEQLEGADDLPELVDSLYRLYQFKTAGKGLSSWFNDRYKGSDGFIHPRFIVPGTSMGRLASSGPNFQNIPARGFGALVRRAVVARYPDHDIVKVDYSQLELRMVLYLAGVDPRTIGADAFKWLVSNSNGAFKRAAEMMADTERQVAKSVSHAFDYLEGFKVIPFRELDSLRIKREIEAGALRVYGKKWGQKRDWEFRGGLVAFTGANLAERLFGDKSWDNRKKALEIQEDIFAKQFPAIREWHWKVLQQIESDRAVRNAVGRYLPLYGSPEDDAKMSTAAHGQGTSADFVQEKMLAFDDQGVLPILQVHDELDFEVPQEWSDARVVEYLGVMTTESKRLPGFVSALKMKRGPSWLEDGMRQIYPQ